MTNILKYLERKVSEEYIWFNKGKWKMAKYDNHKLYQLYNDPDIIQKPKATILTMLGHLFRTD
jgi:hypothetical protein